jgi:Carboxypeptidase regulatory-like domain
MPERLTAAAPPQCIEGKLVTIRIPKQSRKPAAGIEIRWGTEAMLRELPDALLPVVLTDATGVATVSIPEEEDVFARIAGPALASKWVTLAQREVSIAAMEGAAISWQIKDAEGNPATGSRVELRPADSAHGQEWPFRGAGDGTVTIPAVPAGAFVHALLLSDAGAPAVVTGRASRLPSAYELARGVALSGRVVDSESAPLSGASVSTLFLVGNQALKVRKMLRTGDDGRFGIRGVPSGHVEWSIEKPALARMAQVVKLTADHDLGEIALHPERKLLVEVRDSRGNPIEGASLTTTDGAEAKTDEKGSARLLSVPAGSFRIRVAARGYLHRDVTAHEDAKQPFVLVFRDAALIHARVVHLADGRPAGPGTAAVNVGGRKFVVDFDASGELEIDAQTGGPTSIEIRAAGLAPFRVSEREIRAEEKVDLGAIELATGLAIVGRAVDADSSSPLPSVTMYALRPSDFGPLLSYARRDWVTAQTGADGTFRIDGLAPGVYTVWSEATGRASVVKTGLVVASDLPDGGLALGDVTIHTGRTLMVSCTPAARCGAELSVSIAGADWLPLTGAMAEGRATVAPVPPGPAVLRLTDRGSLIHERDVTIGDDPTTEVTMKLPSVTVRGSVLRGGKPVSGGTISWAAVSSMSGRFVQMAHIRNSGTLGNRFVGSVPRRIAVNVTDEGSFVIDDLAPGDYRVVWTNASGVPSADQRVTVPEASEFPVRLQIPSSRLEGKVLTTDGQPSPRTLVTVESGGTRAEAFAAGDGSFVFDGLPPGVAFVRANAVDQRRSETTVEIAHDQTERVDLTLESAADAFTVDVRAAGMPLPNVYVFVRQDGMLRVMTTSAEGTVRIVPPTRYAPVEIAVNAPAHGWLFLPPVPAASTSPIRIDLTAPSTRLTLRKETGGGLVSLFSGTGFPIHEALSMLGVRAAVHVGVPFQLDGLPSGTYSVGVGGVQRQVALVREPRVVDF